MRQSRQEATALAWLRSLPDEVIADRPVLAVHYAGALLLDGKLEGVEARLAEGERWLDATRDGKKGRNVASAVPIVANEAEFRGLPTAIAIFRAAQALAVGDVTATIGFARRALEVVADDDFVFRGSAEGFLGLAAWRNGDLEEGHRRYLACTANLERAGYISDTIGCAISLADIRISQGRLQDALATFERGLERATPPGAPVIRGAADMHTGMAELFLERNDLDAALRHLAASTELGVPAGLEQNPYRWRIAMARVQIAEGNPDAALRLLDEAERQYVSHFLPNVRPIAALRARVWLSQGRLAEALRWASDAGVSADDDLVYLREYEHITFARVLLARSTQDSTFPDDGRGLAQAPPACGRRRFEDGERHRGPGPAGAGAPDPGGRCRCARAPRAGPDACGARGLRPHLRPGRAADGDRSWTQRPGDGSYRARSRRLRAALGTGGREGSAKQALIEPLSERELDVLRLLRSDLDGPGHRQRAGRLAEHRADPHQEHLREARREQPSSGGPSRRGAEPASRRTPEPASVPGPGRRATASRVPRGPACAEATGRYIATRNAKSPAKSSDVVMPAHHIRFDRCAHTPDGGIAGDIPGGRRAQGAP